MAHPAGKPIRPVMEPKVSIVTPSFNQARYVEQCVRSVLDQDYPNAEHVIFDGGSKDGTVDILRRYESRGVRWTSEKDQGQSDAINKGFRAATGDIIGWINSDDWYARGAFRVVLDCFRDHPEAQWVYGNNLFTDPEGRVVRRVRTLPYRWDWLLYSGLLIPQPGIFMRRQVIEECGVLNAGLHSVMDYEWWLRIAAKHPPHFIDRYLAYFRLHEASKTGAGEDKPLWRRERAQSMQLGATLSGRSLKGPLGRWLVCAGKQLARAARTLRQPRACEQHCAPRVVVTINLIAPYRVPLFNALNDHHDIEPQVWALAAAENREWQVAETDMRFPHRVLRGATLELAGQGLEKRRFMHLNTDLLKNLWRERPDVVVTAEFSPASVQAALYCAATGAALVSWSETTPQFEAHIGPAQRAVRRWLLRRAAACIATSSGSREKYRLYGVPNEKIFMSLQTADVDGIARRCEAMRAQHDALRQGLGWSQSDVGVLYVGSFIKRKGLDGLMRGFAVAVKSAPSLKLALIGSGEREAALKSLAHELGVADRVTWQPYRQQPELWDYYGAADAFVLPSRLDTFGVVVTEAMAAGLPVLCSKHAGAAQDLMSDGANGWVIDPDDPAQLAQRLTALAVDAGLRARMGKDSLQRVRAAAPETVAREFYRAILHALASCGRR
ncbi:MAG: glycosyltransferase [Verrucomicrobiia bacterium]|jgi:glycosyltransferase involved in cell wall biosynthesis